MRNIFNVYKSLATEIEVDVDDILGALAPEKSIVKQSI
jgi:hypothetical protein